jgi:gliding motility-associated-like protein
MTFLVTTAGTYMLQESNHCGNATDTIHISYLDAPAPFVLATDTVLCPGASILLEAPVTTNEIIWQDGTNGSTLLADQSGTYTLTVRNACGEQTDDFILTYNTEAPVIQDAPPYPWCSGNTILIDVTQSFPAEYTWQDGSTSPTTYEVIITTACSIASGAFEVIPAEDCYVSDGVYVPNVFSPNGDQVNDFFGVSTGSDISVISINGKIFDRWGNLVFASEAIAFEWDGFFKHEPLQPGVFAYVIHMKYEVNGQEKDEVFAGDVTLVR